MQRIPWDQRLARAAVKPMALTPVTPNHLTTATLVLALGGAGLFAVGDPMLAHWGAGIFVLSRFLDHFDGELARLQGTTSRFGYYYDYAVGAIAYVALFVCIGIGLRDSALGPWAAALGAAGSLSALGCMFLNFGIDNARSGDLRGEANGYPAFAGFELEDGIYLLAPITWLGILMPFFVVSAVGAAVFLLWTLWRLMRLRRHA